MSHAAGYVPIHPAFLLMVVLVPKGAHACLNVLFFLHFMRNGTWKGIDGAIKISVDRYLKEHIFSTRRQALLEHGPRIESHENSEHLWGRSKKQDMSLVTSVSSNQDIVLGICFGLLPCVYRSEFTSDHSLLLAAANWMFKWSCIFLCGKAWFCHVRLGPVNVYSSNSWELYSCELS